MAVDQSTEQLTFWGEDEPRKRCTECGQVFPFSEFSVVVARGKAPYRRACCKRCKAARTRRWSKAHPERHAHNVRTGKLRREYGLEQKDYQAMLEAQNGLCAICKQPERRKKPKSLGVARLSVDHNHKTGGVRQLLCGTCNAGLGKFHDNPALLRAAADYLERHQQP